MSEALQIAQERARTLLRTLETHPDPPSIKQAKDLAEHLVRAIDAFHMEAIRFRMFTLERLTDTGAISLDENTRRMLVELKEALEAAGFHTRSHRAP